MAPVSTLDIVYCLHVNHFGEHAMELCCIKLSFDSRDAYCQTFGKYKKV